MTPKQRPRIPDGAAAPPLEKTVRERSRSPGTTCLHSKASPQKPKRKHRKSKKSGGAATSVPPTQAEIAAQISARIAQLSAPAATTNSGAPIPAVKVKSLAELRSTKIARLTSKIAVNQAEIKQLEVEYEKAKRALEREEREGVLSGLGGLGGIGGEGLRDLMERVRRGEVGAEEVREEVERLVRGVEGLSLDLEAAGRGAAAAEETEEKAGADGKA